MKKHFLFLAAILLTTTSFAAELVCTASLIDSENSESSTTLKVATKTEALSKSGGGFILERVTSDDQKVSFEYLAVAEGGKITAVGTVDMKTNSGSVTNLKTGLSSVEVQSGSAAGTKKAALELSCEVK